MMQREATQPTPNQQHLKMFRVNAIFLTHENIRLHETILADHYLLKMRHKLFCRSPLSGKGVAPPPRE